VLKGIDRNALVRVVEIISYLQTDGWLDKRSAAKYCGVSTRTLESWKGLPRYRPSGKTLFRRSEIDAFMMKHLEAPTDVDVERIADEAVMAILGGK